jgi:hypothetical protein
VGRIEQILENSVSATTVSASTIAGLEPGNLIPEPTASSHPILVRPGKGHLMEDSQTTMTLRVLEDKVAHENAFWFSMVSPPMPILPVIVNPVSGNKARVVQ